MADKKFTVTLTITVPNNPDVTESDIESELKEAMVDAIENTQIDVGTVRELATEPEAVDREQAYRNACKRFYVSDELEMDDNAVVSEGDDDGAFVQTWRWIGADEAGLDEDEEEEDEQDGGTET
jgi:hypothetical protein